MKILVVTPFVPSSIRPRSLGLIEMLATNHSVCVISAVWSEGDLLDLDKVPAGQKIGVKLGKISGLTRMALAVFARKSFQQAYLDSKKFHTSIEITVNDFKPDIVLFNVLRTAQLKSAVGNLPTIIDLDEFRSNYYEQLAKSSSALHWRLFGIAEARRMARAERGIVGKFDRVLISSPIDLSDSHSNIHLVRSLNLMSNSTPVIRTRTKNLVFVGRQSYLANTQAIVWFVSNVWSQILVRHPDAKLNIVGDNPNSSVRSLSSDSINVTGRVEDVREWYVGANASIVPVTLATGVQMKVIEGMSLGTPTIVSSIVARGAGILNENQCLVADSKEEWVEQICRIFEDSELSAHLSNNATIWAQENHSRTAVSSALDIAISGVTETMEKS